MGIEMKLRYRLFRRNNGVFFCEDRTTHAQKSLKTKDAAEATRLLNAKNEADQQPGGFALQIARTYLAQADPALSNRTWRYAVGELIETKRGENAARWERAIKQKAFEQILDLRLIETRPEHFLAALKVGTISTNVFLRRLHNFALGLGWLLAPVLAVKQWPVVRHGAKRAITAEEHQRILEHEHNAERRAYYALIMTRLTIDHLFSGGQAKRQPCPAP